MNPYEVLGVPMTASAGEIRRAFRALVHEHHPDRNGGSPEAAARTAQLIEAFDLLKTDESRASVDAILRPPPPEQPPQAIVPESNFTWVDGLKAFAQGAFVVGTVAVVELARAAAEQQAAAQKAAAEKAAAAKARRQRRQIRKIQKAVEQVVREEFARAQR